MILWWLSGEPQGLAGFLVPPVSHLGRVAHHGVSVSLSAMEQPESPPHRTAVTARRDDACQSSEQQPDTRSLVWGHGEGASWPVGQESGPGRGE